MTIEKCLEQAKPAILSFSNRLHSNALPREDLEQEGYLAVLQLSWGKASSKAYSRIRARGAMVDAQRMTQGIIRVPRKEYEKGNRVSHVSVEKCHTIASNDDHVADFTQREYISRALGFIDHKDREIIRHYFGLDGRNPLLLREIGEILGLHESRVCQRFNRAIEKMRSTLVSWE